MKLLNFALIKITLALILGIILAYYLDFSHLYTIFAITILLVGLLFVLLIEKNRLIKSMGFGLISFILFITIGILTFQLHQQKTFKNHYTRYITPEKDTVGTFTFRIREVLKPSAFHDKYVIDVLQINNQAIKGKVLLNINKDTLRHGLKVDEVFMTTTTLHNVEGPLNPGQFDYGAYLKKQYIHHQIFTAPTQLISLPAPRSTVFGYAAQLRAHINTQLEAYHFKPDEQALINALLLGQRQDISPELTDSYSKAGAIHILAVSGLHVGIVLWLLNIVFKPVVYLKHGRFIKILLILICLWGFAITAGLSASVTRAVTMFSIVAIGINLKRPTNIFNTLAISIFFLLLAKPMFLFDVGFQMSYLAVISIVTFQPLIEQVWQPKFKLVKRTWQIFTVTTAAQLGVAPVSLFYFHQFPGLFFISNLVIIPVLGLILSMGIVVILLSLLKLLPFWVADLYGAIISLMNRFVQWVSLQEQFTLTDISVSLPLTFASYGLLITMYLWLKKTSFKRMAFALIAIIGLQSVFIFERAMNQTETFLVFHKNRFTLIGHKDGTTLTVAHDFDSLTAARDQSIKNYKIAYSIAQTKENRLKSVYFFQNKKLLIIDSLSIYQVPELNPNYILLRDSPQVNLARVLEILKPELIIADGSNYTNYVRQWEATCLKHGVPFHSTRQLGAFVFEGK